LRNLRAELQSLDSYSLVRWNPGEGGIIVGLLRPSDLPSDDGRIGQLVHIEEERTGMIVEVSLETPHLAALYEMQSPQVGDRVGIRYLGLDTDGEERFALIVDRESCPPTQSGTTHDELGATEEETDRDCIGATREERLFMEEMLTSGDSPETEAEVPELSLVGLISRGAEELDRQPRALERLGAVVGAPPASQKPVSEQPTAVERRPRRSGRARRLVLVILAIVVLCGSVAAVKLYVPESTQKKLIAPVVRVLRGLQRSVDLTPPQPSNSAPI